MMTTQVDTNDLRSRSCPNCLLCEEPGSPLYQGLTDRIFNVPGAWNLKSCSNADCGMIWLDPMPIEEDLPKAYKEYFTHQDVATNQSQLRKRYDRAKIGYLAGRYGYRRGSVSKLDIITGLLFYLSPGRRAFLDFGFKQLKDIPPGRLVEIGCGSGELLKTAQDWGWQVEGIDFDDAAVENARSKGLAVQPGDLKSQEYSAELFDAVVMSHVIEHLPRPIDVLRECHRILKPGGVLLIATPNTQAFGSKLYQEAWLHLDPPRHLFLFNSVAVCTLARKAGFEKIKAVTGIRASNGMHFASRSIRKTGRFYWQSKPSIKSRFWSSWMQCLQWLVLFFDRTSGEEIILVGRK